MNKISNKIQIPVKTKIAFAIIFLVGLVAGMCLVQIIKCTVIYGVDGDCGLWPFNGILLLLAYSQLLALGFFLLLGGIGFFFIKNIVWWGCGIFIAIGSLPTLLIFNSSGLLYHFPAIRSLLMIADFCALILLIMDSKNYFAAVEKAKKGKGIQGKISHLW